MGTMTIGNQSITEHRNDGSAGFIDVGKVRNDFPILGQKIKGKPLVYLDNAATTQKPQCVIDAVTRYYQNHNANIHRGVHYLSEKATDLYEGARESIRKFLNAKSSREIIFVRGVTEAINLVAGSYGDARISEGDEIIITTMEHHSNIVPWQLLCDRTGAKLRVVPISDAGEIEENEYESLLSERTKLVSIVHISNALGTINPIKWMIKKAHKYNVPVVIDGAQSIPHLNIDLQSLDCDFFTFSGHKLFGPTGIGVLYGKEKYLEEMRPYQGGGDMIRSVSFEKTTYNDLPFKFEAGTPNVAGAVGLRAAIDYITSIGIESILIHENALLDYATELLSGVRGVQLIGTAKKKAGVLSFVCEGIHPHDIGTILDHSGIAIRAGHHCTQPLMQRLGLTATSRVSLSFYNTRQELEALAETLPHVFKVFGQ